MVKTTRLINSSLLLMRLMGVRDLLVQVALVNNKLARLDLEVNQQTRSSVANLKTNLLNKTVYSAARTHSANPNNNQHPASV